MSSLRVALLRPLANGRNVVGAVAVVAVMVASLLVAQSPGRSEIDVHLSDGAVWLRSTALGGVSLLDGGSGTIATSLGVAAAGDDFEVAQAGSDAIIVNRSDGTISRLSGATWSLDSGRVQFASAGEDLHVVADDSAGWVVVPGQVFPIDPASFDQHPPLPVAAPFASGLVTPEGDLLFASTDPAVPVRRFSSKSNTPEPLPGIDGPTALMNLGTAIAGVDLDDHRVWTSDDGIICDRLEFPPDAELHAAGDAGQLLVVSDTGGAFVWDPSITGCPNADHYLALEPSQYGRPAVTEGWAVVADEANGSILIIDLQERTVSRPQELLEVAAGAEIELIAEDGAIWYNVPAGAQAGLVRRDGVIAAVSKYLEGDEGFTRAPLGEDVDTEVQVASDTGNAANPADPLAAAATEQTTESAQSAEPDETPLTTQPAETEAPAADTNDPSQPDTADPDANPATSDPDTTDPDATDPDATDPDTTDPGTTDPDTTDPDTTDPGTTDPGTTDPDAGGEEDPVIKVTMGVSATQVTAGETIEFEAITAHGSPNHWTSDVSPQGPELQPLEKFGRFRYLFPNPGTFLVSITACDPDENCDTARTQVEIVEDPNAVDLVAAIDGPTVARAGDAITLRTASQGDPDGFEWSTDGGTPGSATSGDVNVSWDAPGTKTVTLTVSRGGRTDTTTQQITVEPSTTDPAPFGLSCSPTAPQAGSVAVCSLQGQVIDFDQLEFDVSSTAPDALTVDDSTPGRASIRSNVGATVTVTLRGVDRGTGDPVSTSTTVNVADVEPGDSAPSVVLNGPATLETGQSGTFTVTNTGGPIDDTFWTMTSSGDSESTSDSQSISISWATPGTHTITFEASGPGGTDTATRTVTVSEPAPVASKFEVSCNVGTAEVDDLFRCQLDGDPANFSNPQWSVGPASANYWFMSDWVTDAAGTEVGSVSVTLTATDLATGQPVTASTAVTIVAPSVPALGLGCSPATRPADGTSAATCAIANGGEFSNISYSVSNPQGLALNQWGSPGETYVASLDPGSVTVTASAEHTTTGETVTAGPVTVTFEALAPPSPAPFTIGCSAGSATTADIFNCSLSSGNPEAFSSPSWSVSPAAASLSWGLGPFSLDVQGTTPGALTVTLTATDIGTGQVVSASATVSIS